MADDEQESAEPHSTRGWPASILRPKGNLSNQELSGLLILAGLPLVIVLVRILSLPDVFGSSLSGTWIPSIGGSLNQALSLQEIPAGDRNSVLYMLFLPISALIIAIARLTFGIRVIGFRAILISVGFQESGIVPSLILIGVVVMIIVGVRPALQRIRLPGTARLSVIMSIGVLVLVAALLLAPWTRSEMLWRVAFFPVIVLGLLAENIAKTMDQNSGLVAVWRTGMTIGIAMLIAGLSQIPVLREIVIQFPELVITEIILIILVSEFLDLRLFQDWDSSLSGMAIPRLFAAPDSLRIAIVRNRKQNGVIDRMGAQARLGYSRGAVRRISASLREHGHTVERFEGDMTLFSKLREFIPPHPRTREPGGIVLDLSSGIQGEAAKGHVAAMLEMAGILYIGSGPFGRMVASDRVVGSQLLRAAGIATPDVRIVTRRREPLEGLTYPVVVRPRHSSILRPRIVREQEKLDASIRRIQRRNEPEAIVEQYIVGREIEVALIGNDPVECLPLVEFKPDSGERICPAQVDPETEDRICGAARAAFRTLGGRDAARVRIRLSRSGTPYVITLESLGGLEEGETFERAAAAAGLPFSVVMNRIVAAATTRCRDDAGLSTLSVVRDLMDGQTDRGRVFLAGS